MEQYLLDLARDRQLTVEEFDREVRSLQLFGRQEEIQLVETYKYKYK